MHRHPIIAILCVIFCLFIFSLQPTARAADQKPPERQSDNGQPDVIVKIHRLQQALALIDDLAAADNHQPTAAPSFFLRSVLFGTDWIDPGRPIVLGITYKDQAAGTAPVMAAFVPFVRKNDDFHISYSAVSRLDHYIVPLPPGKGAPVDDLMADALARAARETSNGLLAVEIAASRLIEKAEPQIQKMLLDLDTRLKNQQNAPDDLPPEAAGKLMENLLHAAGQIETFSLGLDLTKTDITLFSDAKALKNTALATLFTRSPQSRFSRMAGYRPVRDIRFHSASYDIQGMLAFFNALFGEFYQAMGIDLAGIETMTPYFTGEMAGGISLNNSGMDSDTDSEMDIEMISELKETKTPDKNFLESVYIPWIMTYGQKMTRSYHQQHPNQPAGNFFSKTDPSTVNGQKVLGIACDIPVMMPDKKDTRNFKIRFRTTQVDDLLIFAPNDSRLKELMEMAPTLEKKPYTGPVMQMDIQLGAYLKSIQDMLAASGTGMSLNLEDLGSLVYTLDLDKGNLTGKYVLQTDDIKTLIAAFKQAEASATSETDGQDQPGKTSAAGAFQTPPTLLQDAGKIRQPAPKKEDTADFWLDKGLLNATYGNDAQAIKYYKKALQIEPENHRALFNMGISYSSLGQYDPAIDALNQAIFLAPDNGDYFYGLGWAFLLKGEPAKAMEYFRTAADFGNPDAKKYLMKHPEKGS